uniref:Uncharacterized protein n=1 Tax=Globisporangium ultimum (strain ATCC 200006 / CBS 805.95 / DAOM BR144) TaxID=431595 RepID=K3WL73_GLOUD
MNKSSASTNPSFSSSSKKLKSPPIIQHEVDQELENALFIACKEGDVEKCEHILRQIQLQQQQQRITTESVDELIGYAFARAASCNQVELMRLLLVKGSESLRYGICRSLKYFSPIHQNLRCVYALRYAGYAAMMCIEHNTVSAMRFLITHELLDEVEVVRCFHYAKRKAVNFDAPDPGAYRPMLMLLLTHFPFLLRREHCDHEKQQDERDAGFMKALEASLLYEYQTRPLGGDIRPETGPQLQKDQ